MGPSWTPHPPLACGHGPGCSPEGQGPTLKGRCWLLPRWGEECVLDLWSEVSQGQAFSFSVADPDLSLRFLVCSPPACTTPKVGG